MHSPLSHDPANPGDGLFPVRARVWGAHRRLLALAAKGLWGGCLTEEFLRGTRAICCQFYFLFCLLVALRWSLICSLAPSKCKRNCATSRWTPPSQPLAVKLSPSNRHTSLQSILVLLSTDVLRLVCSNGERIEDDHLPCNGKVRGLFSARGSWPGSLLVPQFSHIPNGVRLYGGVNLHKAHRKSAMHHILIYI